MTFVPNDRTTTIIATVRRTMLSPHGHGRPLVDAVLNGFNGTLMAYGQTGTGKTYTMGSMASYSKTQGKQPPNRPAQR